MVVGLGGLAGADTFKEVKNVNSGKCLDVMSQDDYYAANARVQQYHCTGASEQHWNPKVLGINDATGIQYYVFVSQRSGMCLEVYQGAFFAGAQVVQDRCGSYINLADSGAQIWYRYPAGNASYLVNYRSGLCLDISAASTNDHAKVQQWTCNQNAAQKFLF